MAEEGLGGLTGGGDEGGSENESASGGLDGAAAALAMQAASKDGKLEAAATEYFQRLSRFVTIQTEHLHEQRSLALSHLRLRRAGDWFRTATQALVVLVAAAFAAGFALMLRDAFTSNSVVVEALEVPQSLAAAGITGRAAAGAVLDALQKLSDATRLPEQGRKATSAWENDVQIEVPEAGVSIGEINRLLHERFGNDLHIRGDVRQIDAGKLSLTIRGDNVPAKTFTGAAADLEGLAASAAEYIFGSVQPDSYAVYLYRNGRARDALSFLPGAFGHATTNSERSKLAVDWGIAFYYSGQPEAATAKERLAVRLDPRNWKAREMLLLDLPDEEAWREAQALIHEANRLPAGERPPLRDLEVAAYILVDLPLALRAEQDNAKLNSGRGALTFVADATIAFFYTGMHDYDAADRALAMSDETDPSVQGEALWVQAAKLLNVRNAARSIPLLEAAWKLHIAEFNPVVPCYLGLAYGLAGRLAEAEAAIKSGRHGSLCAALHGDVLDHAGDLPGAQRLWADSLRDVPDRPEVYLHRGLSEAARGDATAALADFTTANAKAPHWADALKAWGDLLAQQGKWPDAKAKYQAALAFAPNWKELIAARDSAARHAP